MRVKLWRGCVRIYKLCWPRQVGSLISSVIFEEAAARAVEAASDMMVPGRGRIHRHFEAGKMDRLLLVYRQPLNIVVLPA